MLHRKIKSYRISIYFWKLYATSCIKAINPSTIKEIPVHDKPYNVHIRVSLRIKQYYIWVQTSKPSAHSKNPHCFCLGSGQAKNFLPLLGPSFITVLNAAGLPWFGQIGNFSSAHWNTPKSKISCIRYNSLRYIQENVWNKCHNNLNIL